MAFDSVIDDEGPPGQPDVAGEPSSSSAPPTAPPPRAKSPLRDGPRNAPLSSVRLTPGPSHKPSTTVIEYAAQPKRHNHTTAAAGSSDHTQTAEPLGHHVKLPASPAAQGPSTRHEPAQQQPEMPDVANNNQQESGTSKAAESKRTSRCRSVSKQRSPKKTPATKKLPGAISEKTSKRSTSSGGSSEGGSPSTATASPANNKRYMARASQAGQPKRTKTEVITLGKNGIWGTA